MPTTSAAGLSPELSLSPPLPQEPSSKEKRQGTSRRNVKLSKHCHSIYGLRTRKCTRTSAHKIEKRYDSATSKISKTLTLVNNGELSGNNKSLKKCRVAIRKIDAALFDRKTKLMEGDRHKPCRNHKGRAYNKSDKSQKCTMVALSRQLRRCNGVVSENTRTRSVRSANPSTDEKKNELAMVHQLQQQSTQAQRKITRQLPDVSTDTSSISGKKTTSPFCKDLKNFQIPQRFQTENAQPSTASVSDKLRSLQNYLKVVNGVTAAGRKNCFLASLTQAGADRAEMVSELVKVGQALEQRITAHDRMLSGKTYSRPCKTSSGERETLAQSQAHLIALINAYEVGCSQLGVSPDMALSTRHDDLPTDEGEALIKVLLELKSADKRLDTVNSEFSTSAGQGEHQPQTVSPETSITNTTIPLATVYATHANETVSLPTILSATTNTTSTTTPLPLSFEGNVRSLVTETRDDQWSAEFRKQLTLYSSTLTDVEQTHANEILKQLDISDAYLNIFTLREWLNIFKDFLVQKEGEDSAAVTAYQQLIITIDDEISTLFPNSEPQVPGRKKRSIESDIEGLEKIFSSAVNRLSQAPHSRAMMTFCRGFSDSRKIMKNKLQNVESTPDEQWTPDEILLKNAIDNKKVDSVALSKMLQEANNAFVERDYYTAGEKTCKINWIAQAERLENPTNALNKYLKASKVDFSNIIHVVNRSGVSIPVEINSARIDAVNHLLTLGNPFFVPLRLAGRVGNCFASSLIQALSQNFTYYHNVFHNLMSSEFETMPFVEAANILHAAYNIYIAKARLSSKQSLPPKVLEAAQHDLTMNQGLMVASGHKLNSLFYKEIIKNAIKIERMVASLEQTVIPSSNIGAYLIDAYKAAKQSALNAGEKAFHEIKLLVKLDYGDANHVTVGTVREFSDGRASMYFEDTSTHLVSLTAPSLDALSDASSEFTAEVLHNLNLLRLPAPSEFTLSPVSTELLSALTALRLLPTSPLTLGEITTVPYEQLKVLKQTRTVELYTKLLKQLNGLSVKDSFRSPRGVIPDIESGYVTPSDPLLFRAQEMLAAVNDFESSGVVIAPQITALMPSILNDFTRTLSVINKLTAKQFVENFDVQFLEKVTELSQSLIDLASNQQWASLFPKEIQSLKKEAKKFKQMLDANSAKVSASAKPSTDEKTTLSDDERLEMLNNLNGVLKDKKSLPSWLSCFKKQASPDNDQTPLQKEKALITELQDFSQLFFALTGHRPAEVSTQEEVTLSNETKLIARYGLKKVLDLNPESSLLNPELNPIFAGVMNDPVIKPLLISMNQYFSSAPAAAETGAVQTTGQRKKNPARTTQTDGPSAGKVAGIVLGSLGGAGILGAAVRGIYKSVSSRISSAGDSGAGRGVLVDEEVTDEEVNAVLEELGIDPVNPKPVSQPEANPQSEDIEMPDLPDAPNHPLLPNTEAEEVEDSKAGAQKVKVRCKKSIDGGCSRTPEDEEDTNIETENAADEADIVEPEVIFEDLPGMETVASSAGFRAARSELKMLKNLRWTGTSRVFPATSPIARLLPSTRINWINPGFSSASLIKALQLFPKAALRVLGACSNAALPITYGVTIGLQFAQDIGKWMEQETYEQGLTTVDDIMSYLSLFFPAAMAWQKIAPELALERLHEIKDRFVPWMAVLKSPLTGSQAFEALHDIASDPTLGVGHARFEFPDGTVLYRASYKKADMPISTESKQGAFDQLLQGETTPGRVDFYIITRKVEGQSQVVLASGTYFGITSSVLDTLNTKHKEMALVFRAINRINQKYVFETLDLEEEQRKINSKSYPWQGLSPQDKLLKRLQEIRKLNELKAAKEAESRAKVEPIYSALEEPITSFVFEAKRQEAATHEFFKTTALYAAHNGTLNWQEARNQFSAFMLKEGDEGYRDAVTSTYEYLDPEYRKRVKPAYIGLERENLPVEGTEKAQAQQQNLRVYTINTGKALVDILHFYPDVDFKSSESSPAVNLYESTDDEATGGEDSAAPSKHAFESSVVTVPDILGVCRHARYNAAEKNIGRYHRTYDDVVPTLPFEQIQTTRAAENHNFLDSQTFTYYDVSASNEHVLILRQVSVGALLSSLNGDIDPPYTPRAWRHYSSEMKKHVYRLALQQISGESRLIPIMDSGNRTPMTPTERPVIGPDGQIVKQGAFLSTPEHQFQDIDTCDDDPCVVDIDATIPWHKSETTLSLQKVVNDKTGETETYSSNSPELQIIPNRRKIIFSDAYLKQMGRYSANTHYMLYFYPVDEDGEVISAGATYLARLNHHFFQRKQVLHLREPVDPSQGVFEIVKRLFTADGHDQGGVISTIPTEHISQPPGSVRVHGQLSPGRYVIQANRGDAKQTFVVTPTSSSATEYVQECLTSNQPVSLDTVKERLVSTISAANRYGEYWKVILEQLLDLPGRKNDEVSIETDDLPQGDIEKYQILVTQYQRHHGQYQPCREVGLAEESQHGVDKLVRLIMLCEQSSRPLKKEDLIHLLKTSLALPQPVFEAFVTSQLSIQTVVGGVSNTTLTPERQTMPGRRLLSVGDEFDRNSAMRLGSPFSHMAYLGAKAAEIPRQMILGGTVLIEMGGQLWNQYAGSTQHQANQPNSSDISKVTIATNVLGSCNKDMTDCKPGQVAVTFRSTDEKDCQLISGNQKAPCEVISRPAHHELIQEKPNKSGLKQKIVLNPVNELGGRALNRWNQDTAVMGQGDLHPLTMPGTKAQSWNQVLALYQKNHGKLPDGFGINLGKDGKYYSTDDANSMVCNHSSKQCTISSPLENTSWSEHLAGKLSNWFYQNNQGQQDSQPWASAKTHKAINGVMNASLFDEKARIANGFNTLGSAVHGQMELANIFLHWKNNRTMVPSYKADAGRMIHSSSDKSIINESHQVNIDFLQSAYELIPDLLQDVVDFLKRHTDDTTVSRLWNDADKLNIILLTHSDLSSHFNELLDALPQSFIESYLQDVYHSPIGPEHERYANVFDLTDDSGVCLKGSHLHAAGAIHKQHFFSAIEGEMQPENELGIHFIRSMLNVLAVNALKLISKQHDEELISRCLLIKQEKSAWQSIKDLRPFKPSPITLERSRKHCYQELLSELRQHGRYSSNNENSYSENVKKAELTSTATIKNDKAPKENHYIRFIIDMNSSLENCQISTLDKRMIALFIWESMQELPTENVSGRVAYNHEIKRQMSIYQQVYQQVYQRVIDTQPDRMKYPKLDQGLEQEIASDVASLSFFGLQNRQGKAAGRKLKVDAGSIYVENAAEIPEIGSLSIYEANTTDANSSEKQASWHYSNPEAFALVKAADIEKEVDLQWKRQLTEYDEQTGLTHEDNHSHLSV
ncbi:hypothetical protein [uncultured Endozoicomonas sp.]|uniref:hypothetical protein n=1 Tax=uncultured Endozoicomonas sp. TaxID=432652 RepID=UPI0026061812|nr:hypothetical protein [uncultured Endozoicomonas sp.]